MTIVDVSTTPPSFPMLATSVQLLDFTAILGSGVTIASVSTSLYDLKSGESVALTDDPFFDGNVIFQWIRGPATTPALQGNRSYRLTIDYTDSGGQTGGGQLLIAVFPAP